MTDPTPSAATSTTTVVIGCKLPHGLVMEVGDKKFVLKGNNAARIIGGYGLTEGVPKDFAEQWFREHKDLPYVRSGLVFIQRTVEHARGQAKEHAKAKTGMEPINPMEERPGLVVDADARAKYARQVAENPERNRQIQE